MGCCNSKEGDSKANRIARWRNTGVVALRDSKLKIFPYEVLDMDRMVRTIDLTNNKIVDIPMGISRLVNMQRLILADNLIERLPVNLGKLQSLKVLTLDGNQITTLPDEMGLLVRLEQLSVSKNLLTSLPETIGSLRSLLQLNVSNNQLKSLPESIGSCFSLEELKANGNSIEELPSSVCNLIHLKSLCLDNNSVNQRATDRGGKLASQTGLSCGWFLLSSWSSDVEELAEKYMDEIEAAKYKGDRLKRPKSKLRVSELDEILRDGPK